MKIQVVTSFSGEGWNKYANSMVRNFTKYWPTEVDLKAYHHDCKDENFIGAVNIKYFNLHEIGEHEIFMERWRNLKNVPQDWRYDAGKFTHKVFAITDAFFSNFEDYDYTIWLDADTVTKAVVQMEDIQKWLEGSPDIVHLGRQNTNYSETSFIAFKHNNGIEAFIADWMRTFTSGEFHNYAEWHDGYVFERLLRIHLGHGLNAKNMTPEVKDLEAFNQSPLGMKMTHFKGPKKDAPPGSFKVVPRDCVPSDEMKGKILANQKLISNWIKRAQRHNGTILSVSGGPNFKENINEFKELYAELQEAHNDVKIICVKHVYPYLLEQGIKPWGCTLLDPREFHGVSTTGVVRKDLFKEIDPSTNFFVASMVDPKLTEYLIEKGAKIIGWNAYSDGVKDLKLPEGQFFITGGTCAAIRSISIGHTLGFRNFHLFGYDACVWEQPDKGQVDEEGRPKYLAVKIGPNQRKFYSTGEWIAMAQDYETLMNQINGGIMDINLKVHGDGILAEMQKALHIDYPSYQEIV